MYCYMLNASEAQASVYDALGSKITYIYILFSVCTSHSTAQIAEAVAPEVVKCGSARVRSWRACYVERRYMNVSSVEGRVPVFT